MSSVVITSAAHLSAALIELHFRTRLRSGIMRIRDPPLEAAERVGRSRSVPASCFPSHQVPPHVPTSRQRPSRGAPTEPTACGASTCGTPDTDTPTMRHVHSIGRLSLTICATTSTASGSDSPSARLSRTSVGQPCVSEIWQFLGLSTDGERAKPRKSGTIAPASALREATLPTAGGQRLEQHTEGEEAGGRAGQPIRIGASGR